MTDFLTNWVRFVLLHPAKVAGGVLDVRHANSRRIATALPKLIEPAPPVLDIAGLSHYPASGVNCHLDITGDAFEMEDQRNWADASFKTFVRHLSMPRPYILADDTLDVQTVTIRIEGAAHPAATADPQQDGMSADVQLCGPVDNRFALGNRPLRSSLEPVAFTVQSITPRTKNRTPASVLRFGMQGLYNDGDSASALGASPNTPVASSSN